MITHVIYIYRGRDYMWFGGTEYPLKGEGVREPSPKIVKIYVQNIRILRIRFFKV